MNHGYFLVISQPQRTMQGNDNKLVWLVRNHIELKILLKYQSETCKCGPLDIPLAPQAACHQLVVVPCPSWHKNHSLTSQDNFGGVAGLLPRSIKTKLFQALEILVETLISKNIGWHPNFNGHIFTRPAEAMPQLSDLISCLPVYQLQATEEAGPKSCQSIEDNKAHPKTRSHIGSRPYEGSQTSSCLTREDTDSQRSSSTRREFGEDRDRKFSYV